MNICVETSLIALSVLLEYLCVCLNIPEVKGPKVPVWRGRKWFHFLIIAVFFFSFLGLHEAYHPALFSGASTASLCVWKPLGLWQGTIMSERFYTLRESIILFFSWTTFFSFTTENSSFTTLLSFFRICVPGGFMLATVLGCVCLGIASIIYLVVRFLVFKKKYITCYDLKENGLNVVTVKWGRWDRK